MDTEQFILPNENTPNIERCVILEDKDLSIFKTHVEYCRHIKEIYGLFRVFVANLSKLLTEYHLYGNGRAFHNGEEACAIDDYYLINAYTISIISSGQTLKESMMSFIKTNLLDENQVKKDYISFDNKSYDNSFAFSFLVRMRDYAQHGHLPVTCNGSKYFFDLKVISKKPHFHHNKRIQEKMDEASSMLINQYKEHPTVPLATTLAEYVSVLLNLTTHFYTLIRELFLESEKNYKLIVNKYPENVVDGAFVYDYDGENVDIVNIKDDSLDMFNYFSEEIEKVYHYYSSECTRIQNLVFFFAIVDGKRIENIFSNDYYTCYQS